MTNPALVREALIQIFTKLSRSRQAKEFAKVPKTFNEAQEAGGKTAKAIEQKQGEINRARAMNADPNAEVTGPGPNPYDSLTQDGAVGVADRELNQFQKAFKEDINTKNLIDQELQNKSVFDEGSGLQDSLENPNMDLLDELDVTRRQRSGERGLAPKEFEPDIYGVERQKEIDQIDNIVNGDEVLSALTPEALDEIIKDGLAGKAIRMVNMNDAIQKLFDRLKNVEGGVSNKALTKAEVPLDSKAAKRSQAGLRGDRKQLSAAAEILRDPMSQGTKEFNDALRVVKKINDRYLKSASRDKSPGVEDFKVGKLKEQRTGVKAEQPAPVAPESLTQSRNAPISSRDQQISGEFDILRDQLPNEIVERTRPANNVLIDILKSIGQ